MLQTCLELLTESDILSNGHFNHYTENLIKGCQETIGIAADGVVDELVWEKMQSKIIILKEKIKHYDRCIGEKDREEKISKRSNEK